MSFDAEFSAERTRRAAMSAAGAGVERFYAACHAVNKAEDGWLMRYADHERIVAAMVAEREWRPIETIADCECDKYSTFVLVEDFQGDVSTRSVGLVLHLLAAAKSDGEECFYRYWRHIPRRAPTTTGDDHG